MCPTSSSGFYTYSTHAQSHTQHAQHAHTHSTHTHTHTHTYTCTSTQEFERAIRLMPPGVESWVWVMDFRGFGRRLADFNPALATNFLVSL